MTQYFLPACSNCSSGRSPPKYMSTDRAAWPRLLSQELMSGRKRPDGWRFWPVKVAVVVYHCPGAASSASSFCERAAPPMILASVAGAYAALIGIAGAGACAPARGQQRNDQRRGDGRGAYPVPAQGMQLGEDRLDFRGVLRPHDAALLHAVLEIDERGPELHAERAAQWPALAVFYLDVAYRGMALHHRGDIRLRSLAIAAPAGAEFEHRGLGEASTSWRVGSFMPQS